MPDRPRGSLRRLLPLLFFAALWLPGGGAATAQDLSGCLAGLWPAARAQGIGAATWERHTAGLQADPSVLEAQDAQPEFVTPIWDYLAALVDAERIADGRRMLALHAAPLRTIAARYGVAAETVVAVWGVESDFGRVLGKRQLLPSLATLACAGRRQAYFRPELFAALRILQDGDVTPEALRGSWAGAFGQTQFMPTTYRRLAVDFDGDGRRDLVGTTVDALASTANYLAKAGWRRGEIWGFEVRLPAGFDPQRAGRRQRQPVARWAAAGVRRIDGAPLVAPDAPPDRAAALLLPAGSAGPALLVFRNYDAIFSYNAAESYALAIALLSDRLRGRDGWRTPWPTDDPGLSRAQRRRLQQALLARGHDIGEADGVLGRASQRAIAAEQRRLGWPVDGRAGRKLLEALTLGVD
jgi:lytic murein transglycosylase